MRHFRYAKIALIFIVFAGLRAPGQNASAPSVLPPQFAGWQMEGSAEVSHDPAAADPTNAAVLREYRFTDFSSASFTRDDGRTLKIRAARFADASGAFGAYTFYLQPNMAREEIGDQGASLQSAAGERVLFYRGQVLVDALFSRQSVMSGAELRELAGLLPKTAGSAATLPPVLQFLPRRGYIPNTQKYAEGPEALSAMATPLSAQQVDFNSSAEVTLGHYDTPSGEATLMLIYYTNPQVAIEHFRRMDPAHPHAPPQPGVSTIEDAGTFLYKRTGPMIAVVSGPTSAKDSKALLESVSYEANITWNQATENRDAHDLYLLVLNVVILCAVVGGLAVVAGVAFGGIRILMKRLFPDRVFDRPEQMEFISLRLTETTVTVVETEVVEEEPRDRPEGR